MNDHNSLTVNTQGAWRWYSPVIPQGMEALGTIRRGLGDTGTLCRMKATGIYVQLNAGAVRSLDQRAIKTALGAVKA